MASVEASNQEDHVSDDGLEAEWNETMESLTTENISNGRPLAPARRQKFLLFMVVPFVLLAIVCLALSDRIETVSENVRSKKRRSSVEDDQEEENLDHVFRNKISNAKVKVHANDGKAYKVSQRTALQIENYRQGTGVMLNLHITHHGGTTMCGTLGRATNAHGGRAPSFACNKEKNMSETTGYDYFSVPWSGKEETAEMIPIARKHFHFIGWEFGFHGQIPQPPLSETDWENPNLLSILVMKDPIKRLLAEDGWVPYNYPDIQRGNATKEDWWSYARDPFMTNNYALRVLGGTGCCNGAETERMYLKNAKALVKRFSIILDIDCLSDGIEAVANLVNISLAPSKRTHNKGYRHAPSRERIGYDDVYNYLLEKNKLDIELYEWSKSRALIKCTGT